LSKNVAVFVDVANIFYAAKAAGVDIDYVTLLKSSSAGRDLVRAYAYTGLDPDNENQRNFHDFLRRHGYKVVSKDIRKYGDGKVKANLDIELVVDMMKTARNLDVAIVVSGDGDFAPAIRAVQEMGVRVEVVSFRGNTSSDLIEVADIFTDITQIAKVEKGSSRSGRRVATDDEDLSMTEVPDKMTEGTGDGRRRGRGGRTTRSGEAAPARTSRRAPARETERAIEPVAAEGNLVVLPGEKLSRVRPAAAAAAAATVPPDADDLDDEAEVLGDEPETGEAGAAALDGANGEDGARRRRRRRGGRGRGRGRGRGEGLDAAEGPVAEAAAGAEEADEVDVLPVPAPRRAAFSFGSVWDSQLGVPAAPANRSAGGTSVPRDLDVEDDLDEPAIPEYLIAERRQQNAGRGGRPGARGGRGGAYAAAMDRERFGAGGRGGSMQSGFAGGGQRREIRDPRDNRPARGGQPMRPAGRTFDRPEREPRNPSGDPWSEVPPEIEAMLRAQLASTGGRPVRPAPAAAPRPAPRSAPGAADVMPEASALAEADSASGTPAGRRASRSAKPAPGETATTRATPARGRRRTTTAAPTADAVTTGDAGSASEPAATPAPTRRRTTKAAAAPAAVASESAPGESNGATTPSAAPKRRAAPRKKADTSA